MDETDKSIHTAQVISRINKEYANLKNTKNSFWYAAPISDENVFEWHFTIRGPTNSDFQGALYHGRLVLPTNYPRAAPTFFIFQLNGRFEVGKKICMTASPHNPEMWSPSWGIQTLLDALHCFFITPGEGLLNSVDWSSEERRRLARQSINWKCPVCQKTNAEIVAEFCLPQEPQGPILPSVLVPQNIRLKNSYIRVEKTDADPAKEDSGNNATTNDTESNLEARRRLRRRIQNTSTTQFSISSLLRSCLQKPIPMIINFWKNASVRDWYILSIDFGIIFSVIYILYLIFDIFKNPKTLLHIFDLV